MKVKKINTKKMRKAAIDSGKAVVGLSKALIGAADEIDRLRESLHDALNTIDDLMYEQK